MKIEIAVDSNEADEFANWLNNHGHEANVGTSTGNYIDGEHTANDPELQETLNDLWDEYCNP